MIASPNPQEGEALLLTTFRSAVAAAVLAAALVAPVAVATDAAATCARHTTGVCTANSPHPRGATATCKDGTWSYSAHPRDTSSHHRGVKYWYR
ncbi:hypothetical protein ABZU45_37120 [Streptomyces avermitilis]|uniref:DUF3761 domain-containing protein n=1 Tax=Streptomyces avermitilis TaxID=33903 RepID=UPI0033B0AE4D